MKIQVNQQSVELPEGSSAKDLAEKLNLRSPNQALAVEIGGTLYDLSHSLKEGDVARFINFEEKEGK